MKIVVYLVHGTFKPGAPWVQADSTIARSIREGVGQNVTIRQFTWDGLNRFSSRAHAASALAEELDEVATSREFERICLVAHSHGGNIAFSAVANMKQSSRITAMVSLGTPYLRIVRKAWAPPRLFALTLSFWLGVIFAILAGTPFAIPLGLCVYPFFSASFSRAQKELQSLSILRPSLGGAGVLPVLCIRHGGDEASAWLSILSITRTSEAILAAVGEKFAGHFWRTLFKFWLFSFGLSALFAFSINFGMVGIFLLVYSGVIFLLPILSVVGAFLTSHRFGLGGRPNLKSFFLHPHVTSKPWMGEVHEAKFSGLCGIIRASSIRPLRIMTPHSLGYSDPKAIEKLTVWLKAMCD